MKLTLIRFLLALLLPLAWLPASAQTPQNSDCNVCNCAAVGTASLTAAITAPACPGGSITGQFPAGASTNRRFATAIGNRYRARVCGTTLNTVLYIRNTAPPYTVLAGACDDDGCGTPGGPSSVEFIAAATEYRAYIYDGGTSCAAFATHGIIDLEITCLGLATPPANDEPCNAVPLDIIGLTSCTAPIVGSTSAATGTSLAGLGATPLLPNYSALPTPSGCPNGMAVNYNNGDVWYSVTVPPTGLIGIEVAESGVCALAMGLYTSPDCSAGPYTWVGGGAIGLCTNDGLSGPDQAPGIVFNPATYGLSPGQTVYIRIWERNNNENGNFTICAYNAEAPVNDEPCGAVLLTAGDPCVLQEFNTINAQPLPAGIVPTGFTPTCGLPGAPYATPAAWNPVARDVWFRVVVPGTNNMTVTTVAGSLNDMGMAWYRASAGSLCDPPGYTSTLTQIAGACNGVAGQMPRINSTTFGIALTGGETIYIRVWNKKPGQYFYHGTFRICVTPNNPPPNDNPCGALPLEVNVDCIQTPSTVENATNTPNAPTTFLPGASTAAAPTCGGASDGDVWFTVDVPTDLGASDWVRLNTDGLSPLDLAMAVYRDASGLGCPTQLQLVQVTPTASSCAVGGTTIGSPINASMPGGMQLNVPNITPGERLYVRVWRQTSNQGPFTICATRPVLPCQGTVYDSGGPGGEYANNDNTTNTWCPQKAGDVVTLTFSQFNIEQGWDFMRIYNQSSGAPLAANLIGTYTGTNIPSSITATINAANPNGCLIVVFTADGFDTRPGFTYKVSCGPPPPPPPAGSCNVVSYSPAMVVHPGGTTSYDPGGPTGTTYPGNLGVASTGIAPYHVRYCPSVAGNVVTMNFASFEVEATFDGLYVFNADIPHGTALNTAGVVATQINSGNGAQATWSGAYAPAVPPNGAFWGGGSPGTVTATINAANPNGCLTLVFYTDGIVSGSGWEAQVTCTPPPPPPPPTPCDGLFYEVPGGSAGTYANNVSSVQTFSAPAGRVLSATFLQFNTEDGWDKMYAFDAATTNPAFQFNSGNPAGAGPNPYPTGAFWGTSIPGPFTSSTAGGSLTFHFVSDGSVVRPGWVARLSCPLQAVNDNPCTPSGATLITPSPNCALFSTDNLNSTATSVVPAPGCGNYQGGDVWYRFVAPPSGRVYIDTRAGTLTDAGMALYSAASCAGPFTLIECDDDDGPGLMPAIDRMCNTLTPGTTYYLRVWGYGNKRGTFEICVVEGSMNSTLQNDCGGAFSLCSATPVTGIAYGNGCGPDLNNTNWGCLGTGERQGTWYAFRTNGAGNLGMTITPSGPADVDWAIWQGTLTGTPNPVGVSCQPLGAPIRCSFASQLNTFNSGGAGANPTYATGMGRNTFVAAGAWAVPGATQTDNTDGWVPGITVAANQMYLLFVDDHHLNGLPYQVTWQETPGSLMGCEILPVEALQLQAQAQTHAVDLLWSTTREQNTSHFILERALDGVHFVPFGRTEAVGNAAGLTEYRSVDDGPQVGLNYYRVQLVDIDGAVTLSNVVTALFQPKAVSVMVVPNPTRDQAELLLSAAHEGDLFVRITDGSGRLVASFLAPTGLQRMQLPIAHLEGGSYTVQLVTEKGEPHARTRFVKH